MEALNLYLLCTCMDVLAGSGQDFMDFPAWLKWKENAESQTIATLIQGKEMHHRVDFGNVVYQIFDQVYLPTYGDKRGFRSFFSSKILPEPMQHVLGNVYTVTEVKETQDSTLTSGMSTCASGMG